MTTLNARANQAYHDLAENSKDGEHGLFYHQQEAFEEGWETGYKAAREEFVAWLARLSDEVGDGAQRELFHDLAQEIREERDGREPRWPDPSTIASI